MDVEVQMKLLEFAMIAPLHQEPRTKHYIGLPVELTDGIDTRELMPIARILVIIEDYGSIYLHRFAADGTFAGDTWHGH
ncbi:MAG TPA: hypothetical protein VF739_13100, partial [Ktedonobacterales bacterium]